MIKLIKINHPRNRFWIYFIALITAFSIFSFSFISLADTSNLNTQVDNNFIESKEPIMLSTNADDVTNIEKINTYSNGQSVIVSKTIYTTPRCNNETEECCDLFGYNNYLTQYLYIFNQTNPYITQFINDIISNTKNPEIISGDIKKSFYDDNTNNNSVYPSNTINQINSGYSLSYSPIKTDLVVTPYDSNIVPSDLTYKSTKETTMDSYSKNVPIFLIINLILIITSIFFIVINIICGKKHTLKNINAKRCTDMELLNIIEKLSKELKIKMPQIYVFDGEPNAFVFAYPVSLVISNELIRCLSKNELYITMRHELAHIKNRDIFIKPLLQGFRILFFYNPAVHLIYYKINRERELMADRLYIKTKAEKVMFLEALVKIKDYTMRHNYLSQDVHRSFSLPLISKNLKKLEIEDRFNHLFSKSVKKSFYSISICMIILLMNISLIAVAQNVLSNPVEVNEKQNIRVTENITKIHYKQFVIRYVYFFTDDLGFFNEYLMQQPDFYIQEKSIYLKENFSKIVKN
jgi:beta-lactamase regulating signal transducer with metallopeptidase domain